MGTYLSKPITDKVSSDEENDKIKIGASSMQGWRETQEDAHNSIADFDADTHFFAVYDGHGGREVALYCAQNLPQFIKNTEAYRNGDMSKALIDGFLGFDGTLTSEEVIAELRQLVDDPKNEADISDDSDEENMNKLYEEASMPLDEVIEKYMYMKKNVLLKDRAEREPISPFLRAKRVASSENDKERTESENKDSTLKHADSAASSSSKEKDVIEKECINADSIPDGKTESIPDVETESATEETKDLVENSKPDNHGSQISQNAPSCSIAGIKEKKVNKECDNEMKGSGQSPTEVNDGLQEGEKPLLNEQNNTSTKEDAVDTKPKENGEISKKGRGKALIKTKGIVSVVKNVRPKRSAKQLYRELLDSDSESNSEDEEDGSFQVPVDSSSSEEEIVDVSNDISDESSSFDETENLSNEDEDEDYGNDEEDEEDEEMEDDDDNEKDIDLSSEDIPGASSGCTAVVALMRGTQLFVANAGDSRCIVCKDGKAVDLSVDHKPEDSEEYQRIIKAGGHVNFDGRVNGGLNLSRAIGDHSYKLNVLLPDREQMITALPDVKIFTVTPADEFMVLACDGIWNFMSSQDVVDFVKSGLEEQPVKLSQICEEMFDNCLASNTLGDGTGCDNMTAIIVTFKNGLFKRGASCEAEETSNPKRAKTDDENIAEPVTAV